LRSIKFTIPYILLLIFGVLLLLISIFPNDRTIDIHFHDTIYIIAMPQIQIGLGILLLFFWFIYSFLYKKLFSNFLVWIHIIITLLFFILLVIIPYVKSSEMLRQYNDAHYFLNRAVLGFSIVWAFTQLMFLINILGGILKSKRVDR